MKTRSTLFMVCFMMVLSTIHVYSQTNVALNKPTTTDSFLSGYPGSLAVDGNNSSNDSRWVSANTNWPHWIEVDLQGSFSITQLKFWTGHNGYKWPVGYKFQYWSGSSWVDIISATSNTSSSVNQTFNAVTTSKVRLYGVSGSDKYFRLYELEVYGTSASGSGCGSPSSGPKDNPIAAKYPNEYNWTSNIKWECVFNVNDYSGTATQKFNAARDAAVANGGGIVYFPAGTYTFEDNIYLKSGVVIRGATPSNTDAKSSNFAPSSKLVFPKYTFTESGSGNANSTAFKNILIEDGNNASNIGLVWLDINRAGVLLNAPDPTNAKGENMVIFGIRTNNVGSPEPTVPNTSLGQKAYQRYCYRFTYNINAYNKKNLLIANTRHNDNITDNYSYSSYIVDNGGTPMDLTDGKVKFNFTDHYVIKAGHGKGTCSAGTPTTCPENFREGVVVRDNWMFHTMRVAIIAAGMGLKIQDNIVKDQSNKVHWTHPTGTKLATNSQTLENRAIDWSGYNVTVERNNYEVYRHVLKNSTYASVDGEGILIQECCGGSLVNGVDIIDNYGNTYIGLYKTRDINNATIKGNTLTDAGGLGIYVTANTNSTNYIANNVIIENNTVNGNINLNASGGAGSGNRIRNNTATGSNWVIGYSCVANVEISNNSGFTVSDCKLKSLLSSVENIQSDGLKIYPNPTSGVIHIQAPENSSIEIIDLVGRKVYSGVMKSDSETIDLSGLNGVFIVKVNNEMVQKLIVK